MKRICCVFLALVLASSAACAARPLPEGFSAPQVLTEAESIVSLLSSGDYEAVCDRFSAEMAAEMDAAALSEALDGKLSALGRFGSFISETVAGSSDDAIGDFAVAVLACEYENGKAVFTISIDKNGDLCGLYMK